MRKRFIIFVAALFLLPGVFAFGAGKTTCDSACLKNYIDRYLEAMKNDNPSLDLFTRDCKFTENGAQLPLGGQGLWYSMSGRAHYNFYVPDVETRQIAYIGTVMERDTPARNGQPAKEHISAVSIRLKIDDNGKICEAEQLVMRPEKKLFPEPKPAAGAPRFPPTGEAIDKMGAPNPIFNEVIPEKDRMSREEYIRIANYYFEGLQRNDGKGYYPFTDDCVRFENGMESTKDCKKNFESVGVRGIVSSIRDRRFVAVDREHGIVFAFGFFDHVTIDWTWEISELFKIEHGKIRRVEAAFLQCPYGMNSGWSTYQQGRSEEIQSIR